MAGLPNTGLHRFGNATELSPEIPERDELVRLQRDADAAGALVVHAGVNYSSPASSMPCCALSGGARSTRR